MVGHAVVALRNTFAADSSDTELRDLIAERERLSRAIENVRASDVHGWLRVEREALALMLLAQRLLAQTQRTMLRSFQLDTEWLENHVKSVAAIDELVKQAASLRCIASSRAFEARAQACAGRVAN